MLRIHIAHNEISSPLVRPNTRLARTLSYDDNMTWAIDLTHLFVKVRKSGVDRPPLD